MFALVIEPLAQAIRAHTDIAGLTVNQFAHKIGLYADDIIIWLTDPLHSLSAALRPSTPIQSVIHVQTKSL